MSKINRQEIQENIRMVALGNDISLSLVEDNMPGLIISVKNEMTKRSMCNLAKGVTDEGRSAPCSTYWQRATWMSRRSAPCST